MSSECALHKSIVMAICLPKIIKFCEDLTKFWQKQVGSFLAHPVHYKIHYENIKQQMFSIATYYFRHLVFYVTVIMVHTEL